VAVYNARAALSRRTAFYILVEIESISAETVFILSGHTAGLRRFSNFLVHRFVHYPAAEAASRGNKRSSKQHLRAAAARRVSSRSSRSAMESGVASESFSLISVAGHEISEAADGC